MVVLSPFAAHNYCMFICSIWMKTIQFLFMSPNSLFFFLYCLYYICIFLLPKFSAAALEKELWSTATINEEVLKTIYVIFTNFKKLRTSEAATLCIPHLVGALKSGNETAQETVLDTLCLLKESWSQMNEDIAKAQALIASEAIPILQMLMKTCPPSFHERADSLLHCLPGCLTVTIKRGNNLKQTMGSTNAFCCLKIGNGPPRQTKVGYILCETPKFSNRAVGKLNVWSFCCGVKLK